MAVAGERGTRPGWHPRWDWDAACRSLRAADPALAPALRAALPPRPDRTPFGQLVRAICAQQISVAAADAVEARLAAACGGEIGAEALGELADTALRAAGLSGGKVASLRSLVAADRAGWLEPEALAALDDESMVRRLCALPGIGRWSAEMLLLFGLHRPDVLPAGDLGVRAALGLLLGLPERPSPAAVRERGQLWRPHRSTATLALWAWRRLTAGRANGPVES